MTIATPQRPTLAQVFKSLLVLGILLGTGFGIALALELYETFAIAFGVQWLVFFLYALPFHSERLYDLTGGWSFLICVAYSLSTAKDLRLKNIVLSTMVCIWALRLSSFLFLRICRDKVDRRFDHLRHNPLRFFIAWNFQGLWVFVTALPVFVVNKHSDTLPEHIQWGDAVGWILWITGLLIEIVADHQKGSFNAQFKGQFIDSGLWRYSRHPNYFGEIMLWIGIFISACSTFSNWMWLCILSPLLVIFLLTMVSGIPMVERQSDKKWGHDPQYIKYKQSVNVLIIGPRRGDD